ncbi:MAG TPA: hypothetical protein VEH07_08300, partial [Alphaproteobacteria bacterium]|nr:hypothetical protein [Alphaproteobacteria bacterium]
KAARRADPLSRMISLLLQQALDIDGRTEEAWAEYERSKDLAGGRGVAEQLAALRMWKNADPERVRRQFRLSIETHDVAMPVFKEILKVFDSPTAALTLLRKAFADPAYQDPTRMTFLSWWFALYGDTKLSLAAMQRAYLDLGMNPLKMLWLPVLGPTRKQPAFKQILRDLGVVDYWRATGNWGEFARPLGDDDFEIIR